MRGENRQCFGITKRVEGGYTYAEMADGGMRLFCKVFRVWVFLNNVICTDV